MKRFGNIVALVSLLALGACSRSGTETLEGKPLQGTWLSNCVSNLSGVYKTKLTIEGTNFTTFDVDFASAGCTGNETKGAETKGTLLVGELDSRPGSASGARFIDWISSGQTTYDIFRIDSAMLIFAEDSSVVANQRPTALSTSRAYQRQ